MVECTWECAVIDERQPPTYERFFTLWCWDVLTWKGMPAMSIIMVPKQAILHLLTVLVLILFFESAKMQSKMSKFGLDSFYVFTRADKQSTELRILFLHHRRSSGSSWPSWKLKVRKNARRPNGERTDHFSLAGGVRSGIENFNKWSTCFSTRFNVHSSWMNY